MSTTNRCTAMVWDKHLWEYRRCENSTKSDVCKPHATGNPRSVDRNASWQCHRCSVKVSGMGWMVGSPVTDAQKALILELMKKKGIKGMHKKIITQQLVKGDKAWAVRLLHGWLMHG